MKCSDILKLLTLSLVLLVSCERESLPIEEPGELIRIEASGTDVQTRGLLNADDLKTAGTIVKIYDYLTGFTGKIGETSYTNGDVMYIDDAVKLGTTGGDDWAFQAAPWRWTRTGTHHFFGYLTEDAKSGLNVSALCAPTFTNNTLSVPVITFTKTTPQFDFSYSDIVTKTAPSDVEIPLKHLFTALAVTVKNEAKDAVTVSSISLSGIVNGRSATVDYSMGTNDTRNAVLTAGTAGTTFDVWSGTTPISIPYPADATVAPDPVNAFSGETIASATLTNTDFRLLWPQESLASTKLTISYKVGTGETVTKEVQMSEINLASMEAGKKYVLNIVISYSALYVNPTVADWVDVTELSYTLKMNTNMRLFDSWLYRYDTIDQNYSDWKNNWEGSHMAVSDGRATATETETVAGRPLRSPQIQLVTTGSGSDTFELRVDNSSFEIVRANKNNDGVVTSYEASTDGVLTIPAGEDVYTYFYIAPKVGVTPSNPVAKVTLIYNDSVLGPQKVPFNYGSLPGYSDDSSEIWAYYFPVDQYNITGKLKMYFQDYNHPLVPTAVQN